MYNVLRVDVLPRTFTFGHHRGRTTRLYFTGKAATKIPTRISCPTVVKSFITTVINTVLRILKIGMLVVTPPKAVQLIVGVLPRQMDMSRGESVTAAEKTPTFLPYSSAGIWYSAH